MSILGALLLVATIGAGVGLLATRTPVARMLAPWASITVGVIGAVLAGFVLPQLGVPVSKSLYMGVVTSALGAALPFVVLSGFRK